MLPRLPAKNLSEVSSLRRKAQIAAVICVVILLVDFMTLENRAMVTDPSGQALGRTVLTAASLGLAASVVVLLLARGGERPASPTAGEMPATTASTGDRGLRDAAVPDRPVRRNKLRKVKIAVSLLVMAGWLVAMPVYVYQNLLSKSPDFESGPWIADAFLSLYAVGMQMIAPTPFALAFWPSMVAAVCLLRSRKDRPVVDAILCLIAVGPAALLIAALVGSTASGL